MKKAALIFFRIIVTLMVVVAAAYIGVAIYVNDRFFYGTTINGVDVSLMDEKEAASALNNAAAGYRLMIMDNQGLPETVSGRDLGLGRADASRLGVIISRQSPITWPRSFYQTFSYEDAGILSIDKNKAVESLENLNMVKFSTGTPSTDAFVRYNHDDEIFEIVPETYGDVVSPTELIDEINYYACTLNPVVDAREVEGFDKPDVLSTDEDVVNEKDLLNSYIDSVVTYIVGDYEEVVDRSLYHDWLEVSGDNVELDTAKVRSFVDEMAEKYDTYSAEREITTSWGDTVTLKSDDFGWEIDRQAETEALTEDILGHRNLIRDFRYIHEGISHGNTDLGDSYVEVNMTKQHLYLYVDGEAVLDTDIVTGNLRAGHRTPEGIYRVTGKARNRYLIGPDYRTFVNYWMPFNKNIGFHDATWRGQFGGEIYKTAGSHGCVNMPKAKAAELYDIIDKDFLVICYYEE